ncbi:YgaP family membrane protein [Methylomonas albis]|jgi:hypothetical protein|uniref:DUF2892 domain-containing protein n=1 Tax=Methylomonas albis TaxID=1854563 RepID=A0ABR9D363_9GAMM|nr:DUF2892 domain-containing protein [Methylomonas albis]MBD9357559.1 DUF2892 domain-containing protein [Methylomonas albis]
MSFDYKRLIKFEHNIGEKDKKVRMVSGVVLLSASLFTASILMLLVGLVLVATSYSGWCPAYSSLDKNTLGSTAASDSQ